MNRIIFQNNFHRSATILALLLTAHLHAQTVRSGGARTGATTRTGARTGSTSLNSTSTGPRQYRSNTLLGDATIQVDPESRSLVIVTDEETHGELMKVIQTLDQPKRQVLIKVVFVEVTYNKGYDVGLEGSYTFNQSRAVAAIPAGTSTTNTVTAATAPNASGGTTTTTTTANNSLTTTATDAILAGATKSLVAGTNFGLSTLTDGTFVRLLTDDWSATLRAIATRGKVEVLSRPSIMARNNQEAVIVVGQEVPFITNSRTDNNGNIINTIQYDDIGIILRVTPFITSEGTVEMIVAPEISTLTDQTVPISSTASAPVIAKRSAETVVVTPNGATVVIGGLMETQRTLAVRKVPLLGDIPLLGMAFRRTVKDDVKRELMIFLTPHIINDSEGLRRVTNDETDRADLIHSAFTEKEFTKYLDPRPLFPADEPALPTRDGETQRRPLSETSDQTPAIRPAEPAPDPTPPIKPAKATPVSSSKIIRPSAAAPRPGPPKK